MCIASPAALAKHMHLSRTHQRWSRLLHLHAHGRPVVPGLGGVPGPIGEAPAPLEGGPIARAVLHHGRGGAAASLRSAGEGAWIHRPEAAVRDGDRASTASHVPLDGCTLAAPCAGWGGGGEGARGRAAWRPVVASLVIRSAAAHGMGYRGGRVLAEGLPVTVSSGRGAASHARL